MPPTRGQIDISLSFRIDQHFALQFRRIVDRLEHDAGRKGTVADHGDRVVVRVAQNVVAAAKTDRPSKRCSRHGRS